MPLVCVCVCVKGPCCLHYLSASQPWSTLLPASRGRHSCFYKHFSVVPVGLLQPKSSRSSPYSLLIRANPLWDASTSSTTFWEGWASLHERLPQVLQYSRGTKSITSLTDKPLVWRGRPSVTLTSDVDMLSKGVQPSLKHTEYNKSQFHRAGQEASAFSGNEPQVRLPGALNISSERVHYIVCQKGLAFTDLWVTGSPLQQSIMNACGPVRDFDILALLTDKSTRVLCFKEFSNAGLRFYFKRYTVP